MDQNIKGGPLVEDVDAKERPLWSWHITKEGGVEIELIMLDDDPVRRIPISIGPRDLLFMWNAREVMLKIKKEC